MLLDRISEHLKEPRHAELDYRLAIFHGQGERGGARDDLRIERAAVIAEGLVRRGLPAERLSVGLYPAALDSLRFEFQVGLWSSEADPEGDETP